MSLQGHIITGTLSATIAIASIVVWHHFHPPTKFAKVDIIGIISAQQKELAEKVKPGMDEKAQKLLLDQASSFGSQLGVSLARVAAECQCTLINSAAIVKDTPSGAMRDLTQRVSELAHAGK